MMNDKYREDRIRARVARRHDPETQARYAQMTIDREAAAERQRVADAAAKAARKRRELLDHLRSADVRLLDVPARRLDGALTELHRMIADAADDNPDVDEDSIAHDMILSYVDGLPWTRQNLDLAYEVVRTQLGFTPQELVDHFERRVFW